MQILVIGCGYVGLVSGTCFSEMGHSVTCLDIDSKKIKKLQEGVIPIYEPGLGDMLKKNIEAGRLSFTTSYEEGLKNAHICIIAVDTPPQPSGAADLSAVQKVCVSISEHLSHYVLLVIKSTVPVGTSHTVAEFLKDSLSKKNKEIPFDIVSNPEFLKEGCAITDFMKPDRIIIGTNSVQASEIMKKLYSPFKLSREKLLFMDNVSAEMTKYTANAMLASRISFMNEIANLCEKMGADIDNVRKGIGADKRIGTDFLSAGIGYGGSCLPKDINALRSLAKSLHCETLLIDAINEVNQKQKNVLGMKIHNYFLDKGGIKEKCFGILGLAFKPETDDMREASSLVLIKFLLSHGATVKLYDPIAMENAKTLIPDQDNVIWCLNEEETAKGVAALVLVTEWNQFRTLNFQKIKKHMNSPVIFDGRNQYKLSQMEKIGFDYISIGRPAVYANSSAPVN